MTEKRKPGRPKKEQPATPEQLQNIQNILGEPLEEFVRTFTDESKRKLFSENLAKRLRQTEMLTAMSSSNGRYQPIYSEQLFQQVNINPVAASSTQIEKWLLAPQYFDKNLRHLSQYLSYSVGQYNRSIYYLNTIKSYQYTLLPSDSDIEENINMKDYLHAYDICLKTLQKMNIKYQIPKVDFDVMQNGVGFYWVSETNDTISLLPLPADYCYITAPFTYGFLFAIDLVFFDQFVSIPNQIPELTKAYEKFTEMRTAMYKGLDLAPYQYYQVPPSQGWVFTFSPTQPDKLPPLTSAMGASLDVLSYKELLKNKIALDLYKVIAMKIPLDKDNKQMAISYKLAEEITQVIQSLLPENIKVFSAPFESQSISTDQTNRFDEIVGISNDTYYASAGMSQGLFGSSQVKMAAALQLSTTVDFAYASTHLYQQYSNWVNFMLLQKTKKYRFQVRFSGNKLNEAKEIDQAMQVVRTCNTGIMDLFSKLGYEPFQVKSTLILEEALNLKTLMTPLVSGFNSKQTNNGGRPTQTTVDDAGDTTRGYDSNDQKFSLRNCLSCGNELDEFCIDHAFCNDLCKEDYCRGVLDENE